LGLERLLRINGIRNQKQLVYGQSVTKFANSSVK
jgi:hypothetical protein